MVDDSSLSNRRVLVVTLRFDMMHLRRMIEACLSSPFTCSDDGFCVALPIKSSHLLLNNASFIALPFMSQHSVQIAKFFMLPNHGEFMSVSD